jgi:HSP20 family molecular chaperone IbpA
MFRKKLLFLALPLAASLSLHAANPLDDPFFNDPFGDNIFKEMMQMQKDMDKMFERMQRRMNQRSAGLVSPLGTYKMVIQNQIVDKGDHYELLTTVPESKENHITVNTANGMMQVTAKIVEEKEQKSQYGVRQSRAVRMYQQSTSLPADADDASIQTFYRDGKLVISIGKKRGSAKSVAAPSATKTAVKQSAENKAAVDKEKTATPEKAPLPRLQKESNSALLHPKSTN